MWWSDRNGRRDPGGSQTAQRVAALRAEFDRPRTPDGDPDAQRSLCHGMRPSRAPGRRRQLLARTRFFDQAVLDALGAGVGQVVIVGAGYDDRALRFRAPGVTFFELDLPATQADKRRRLQSMAGGPGRARLVPIDLGCDDVVRALDAAGHAARPTQPVHLRGPARLPRRRGDRRAAERSGGPRRARHHAGGEPGDPRRRARHRRRHRRRQRRPAVRPHRAVADHPAADRVAGRTPGGGLAARAGDRARRTGRRGGRRAIGAGARPPGRPPASTPAAA